MVAPSESVISEAPPGGGLTMTSYPVGNNTSLSRKHTSQIKSYYSLTLSQPIWPSHYCIVYKLTSLVLLSSQLHCLSQEEYISRVCGATPSGRIPTTLGTCVRLTDEIKRAQFHRYNLRGFLAVRC